MVIEEETLDLKCIARNNVYKENVHYFDYNKLM